MKKVRKRSEKRGLPPGSLIGVGEAVHHAAHAHLFTYNKDELIEGDIPDAAQFVQPDPAHHVSWLDLDGIDNQELLATLGQHFDLHPLLLEDVLNVDHRPKVEEYPNSLFVVVKMLDYDKERDLVRSEQVSFVLGKGYVLSFQERPGDVLEPIRERLRNNLGRVRRMGPDYLLYVLLDVIVDNYFGVLDALSERVSELEQRIMVRPREEDLRTIQELRHELITLGRNVTPTRELAGRMSVMEHTLIEKGTKRYLNDLQDHTVYIAESIGSMREEVGSLENTYHAMVNLQMNQVMKLLTVISTIFIPLSFIAGLYGMNFQHMPELGSRYGYYIVLGVMAAIAIGMLAWLRHRKWL